MAEFEMYGTPVDWEKIVSVLFHHKELWLISDIFYPGVRMRCYRRNCPGFRKGLAAKRRAFIGGPFTRRPMGLLPISGWGYSIDESTGGPVLDLSLPVNESAHDGVLLRPGGLFHQRWYNSEDCAVVYKPSIALKKAYAMLIGEFKAAMVSKRIGMRVWIGEDALRLLLEGKAKITVWGKWWTYRKGIARRDSRRTT